MEDSEIIKIALLHLSKSHRMIEREPVEALVFSPTAEAEVLRIVRRFEQTYKTVYSRLPEGDALRQITVRDVAFAAEMVFARQPNCVMVNYPALSGDFRGGRVSGGKQP